MRKLFFAKEDITNSNNDVVCPEGCMFIAEKKYSEKKKIDFMQCYFNASMLDKDAGVFGMPLDVFEEKAADNNLVVTTIKKIESIDNEVTAANNKIAAFQKEKDNLLNEIAELKKTTSAIAPTPKGTNTEGLFTGLNKLVSIKTLQLNLALKENGALNGTININETGTLQVNGKPEELDNELFQALKAVFDENELILSGIKSFKEQLLELEAELKKEVTNAKRKVTTEKKKSEASNDTSAKEKVETKTEKKEEVKTEKTKDLFNENNKTKDKKEEPVKKEPVASNEDPEETETSDENEAMNTDGW